MKETIVPVSIVIGVFVFILVIAGVWVYIKTTPHSDETATPLGTEQQGTTNPTGTTTQTMDTTNAGPKYEITPGLEAQDIVEGSGTPVKAGDHVFVKYTGTLPDGTVFDSTDLHGGQPFDFTLGAGGVIKGWDMGVVGMKAGGVRILTIAAALGYGPNDYGPIPGNSTLTFKVEMVGLAQ